MVKNNTHLHQNIIDMPGTLLPIKVPAAAIKAAADVVMANHGASLHDDAATNLAPPQCLIRNRQVLTIGSENLPN